MGILSRCKDILSANINALLDKAEDPAKMIDQMLRQSREDLAEVKKETAAVMANETNAKRKLDEAKEKIAQYGQAAMNAVQQGNDDDARKLLSSKQKWEATLSGLQSNYDEAHQDAENMRSMYAKLVNDIELLETKADMIKGKAATAKAREHANKMTAGAKVSSSMEAFGRMEAKVNKQLDTANAMAELNKGETSSEDLLAQYGTAPSGSVEDELARMKAQMAAGNNNGNG